MTLQKTSIRKSLGRAPRLVRAFLAVIVFCVLMFFFVASPYSTRLVAVEKSDQKSDFVMVSDTECGQCVKAAAELGINGNVEGILIYREEPTRLVVVGAVAPYEQLALQKFVEYGVDPNSVTTLPAACLSDWDVARRLNTWLQEHPSKRVRVLADQFSSRRIQMLIDRRVDASHRDQVTIEGVPDTRYDETNWWTRRSGIKSFLFNVCRIQYVWWIGEDVKTPVDWSADKYEAALLE